MQADGVVNLNKPAGMTSRVAVDRVRRVCGRLKAGHAGTLDPLASGVLVVCVGKATRLMEYIQQMPKRYRGTFLLGRESPTEDLEGEVRELADPPTPSLAQIQEAAAALTGWIEQQPPAYSALKIQGRRAYELARRGRDVPLKPRRILVHGMRIESYEYPELRLEIECGAGTYVRSLGRDLALSLGTAAVMSGLVRTAVGGFRLEDAVEPDRLTRDNWLEHLGPSLRAVPRLPRVELSTDEVTRVRNGMPVTRTALPDGAAELAAVDPTGRLVAILVPRGPDQLGPVRNLLSEG